MVMKKILLHIEESVKLFLDKATNFNAKTNITDSQSGLRAFAAYTIPAFKFREAGYGIESEMIIEASNAGFKILEVPIGVQIRC